MRRLRGARYGSLLLVVLAACAFFLVNLMDSTADSSLGPAAPPKAGFEGGKDPSGPVGPGTRAAAASSEPGSAEPEASGAPAKRPGRADDASAKPLAGKVIALDPGHGGRDRGARGPAGSHEADNTLATALRAKEVLEEAGARVVLTRTGDYDPGYELLGNAGTAALLAHRVVIAEKAGADVLISIHNDANPNRALTGTTTYTWRDFELAEAIQEALVSRLKSRDVGVLRAPFWVVQRAQIPAVLVEIGFISNPREEALLASEHYQRLAAEGLRDGLIRYFQAQGRG